MSRPTPLSLVLDAADPLAGLDPVRWAVEELRAALIAGGCAVSTHDRLAMATGEPVLLVTGWHSPAARAALGTVGLALPEVPEAFVLLPTTMAGKQGIVASAGDERGLVYAVLELADRVCHADDPVAALRQLAREGSVVERPTNRIRGIVRVFASDVEDLGWYHDREFWRRYLSMLAAQRYNRFQLALGIGFDFAQRMRDSYFYFPYPFLLSIPGYDVRAVGVSDDERERNLETLRFIAAETKRRGLHFQLGLWAQVYEFADSPDVNHPIAGLTPENHAAYCRDAVRALLRAVPDIDGLTLRVHGESGIVEGSDDFWRTFFAGIANCGRRVEIDLHAKGIDRRMIDCALGTGQPVTISPKFWAEHLGLPYHQADIRAVEHAGQATGEHARLMAMSAGTRRFTRYGYADFLVEDRPYGILFRIWPGTQRLLLWGDPVTGRAYGRAFGFCGVDGAEVFEPLSFSGRRGSGLPAGRDPYADAALRPDGPHGDWEKYLYTYRLWGRLLYNPDADPEQWRRYLRHEFGAAAAEAEAALGSASRILPLVTTAHHPSAANNRYWPEIYTDMPIVWTGEDGATRPHHYADTASPRRFGNVSALDPEVFASVEEYVAEVLSGSPSGRYSPLDVARWLEDLARVATENLDHAAAVVPNPSAPNFRRWALDVRIQAALGRFFAAKFQAGVDYTRYAFTGEVPSLGAAVARYRAARDAWAAVVEQAHGAYKDDLTFGPEPFLRGHWADRLAAIDRDIRDMETELARAGAAAGTPSTDATPEERRPEIPPQHVAPASFTPGVPLTIEVVAGEGRPTRARLYYRHINQAERFRAIEMGHSEVDDGGGCLRGDIPGDYTGSPFPLQYFFELRDDDGRAWRWPGLGPELADQPYFVVRPLLVPATGPAMTVAGGDR